MWGYGHITLASSESGILISADIVRRGAGGQETHFGTELHPNPVTAEIRVHHKLELLCNREPLKAEDSS